MKRSQIALSLILAGWLGAVSAATQSPAVAAPPSGTGGALRLMVEIMMLLAALCFGAYAIVVRRREGVPVLDVLGLRWSRGSARDLVAGLVIASAIMAGIFLVERALGAVATAPRSAEQSLGALAAWKLVLTFKEEFLMRALLLTGLLIALRGRAWLALVLSAVAFGCIHLSNPGSTALSVMSNSLGGVMYGMAFLLTGRLWLPWGLHFAWNFVQGPLLGFPVSGLDSGGLQTIVDHGPAWLTGGSYGPEGGLVCIAFRFLLMAMVLWVASLTSTHAWRRLIVSEFPAPHPAGVGP